MIPYESDLNLLLNFHSKALCSIFPNEANRYKIFSLVPCDLLWGLAAVLNGDLDFSLLSKGSVLLPYHSPIRTPAEHLLVYKHTILTPVWLVREGYSGADSSHMSLTSGWPSKLISFQICFRSRKVLFSSIHIAYLVAI